MFQSPAERGNLGKTSKTGQTLGETYKRTRVWNGYGKAGRRIEEEVFLDITLVVSCGLGVRRKVGKEEGSPGKYLKQCL